MTDPRAVIQSARRARKSWERVLRDDPREQVQKRAREHLAAIYAEEQAARESLPLEDRVADLESAVWGSGDE